MNTYRLFSLMFSYPSAETVQGIAEMLQNGDYSKLSSPGALMLAPLEALQSEYTKLFISDFPFLLCPPYESYYREGIVYGNALVEVAEFYRAHGLNFAYEGEPPDLLSAELDFMAITNNKAFLKRLKEWVFGFTERVKKHSEIYGVCSDELEGFLKQEQCA